MYKSDRKRAPLFPDMLHWFLGYATCGLALVNVWLGLTYICASATSAVYSLPPSLSLSLSIYIFLYLSSSIFR
jgi:hypothetical protein